MKYLSIFSISAALLVSSCSAPVEKKSIQIGKATTACSYQLDGAKHELTWTAFKTSSKVAVGGTFDEFSLSSGTQEGSVIDLLRSGKFKIPVSSINSNNEDRDMKIGKFFFGSLLENELLEGEVLDLTGDESSGIAKVNLKLNALTKELEMKYNIDGGSLSLEGSVDVENWNAMAGINALNEVCKQLHTGEDGVSKLWSQVDLKLSSSLNPNCN